MQDIGDTPTYHIIVTVALTYELQMVLLLDILQCQGHTVVLIAESTVTDLIQTSDTTYTIHVASGQREFRISKQRLCIAEDTEVVTPVQFASAGGFAIRIACRIFRHPETCILEAQYVACTPRCRVLISDISTSSISTEVADRSITALVTFFKHLISLSTYGTESPAVFKSRIISQTTWRDIGGQVGTTRVPCCSPVLGTWYEVGLKDGLTAKLTRLQPHGGIVFYQTELTALNDGSQSLGSLLISCLILLVHHGTGLQHISSSQTGATIVGSVVSAHLRIGETLDRAVHILDDLCIDLVGRQLTTHVGRLEQGLLERNSTETAPEHIKVISTQEKCLCLILPDQIHLCRVCGGGCFHQSENTVYTGDTGCVDIPGSTQGQVTAGVEH